LTTFDTDSAVPDPTDCPTAPDPADDGSERGANEPSEARTKLIAEAKKYRKRAQEAERRLAELETRVLDDADYELFERLKGDSDRARQDARDLQTRIAELTEQHSQELIATNTRVGRLTGMLSEVVVTDRLKTTLASRGVKHVSQAAKLLAEQLKVDITDNGCSVRLAGGSDTDGADPRDGEATVERLVDDWLADNPHYLPPSGDTGSGAYPGVSTPRGLAIEQLDLNPARKAEFVARYGPAALVQLARGGRKSGRR